MLSTRKTSLSMLAAPKSDFSKSVAHVGAISLSREVEISHLASWVFMRSVFHRQIVPHHYQHHQDQGSLLILGELKDPQPLSTESLQESTLFMCNIPVLVSVCRQWHASSGMFRNGMHGCRMLLACF